MVGEPAQLRDGQPDRLRQLGRRREHGQASGGQLLDVPACVLFLPPAPCGLPPLLPTAALLCAGPDLRLPLLALPAFLVLTQTTAFQRLSPVLLCLLPPAQDAEAGRSKLLRLCGKW